MTLGQPQNKKRPRNASNMKGFGGLSGAHELTTIHPGKQNNEPQRKQLRPLRRKPGDATIGQRNIKNGKNGVVASIIAIRRNQNKKMSNSKRKNYPTIRKEMQFNKNQGNVIRRIREMGGHWTFNGNDIHFFDVGDAKQKPHAQLIMLHENKMEKNQHPWHTHPYLRGFWPSIEDMYSILRLPLGKFHLIISLHGTWVLSKNRKNNNIALNNTAFKNSYKQFEKFFGGIVGKNNNGKNKLLERGRAQELYEMYTNTNKHKSYNLAVKHFIDEDLPKMREEWKKFGIEMQFFQSIDNVREHLKVKMPNNRRINQSRLRF